MTTLTKKWASVLDFEGAPKIADAHRRSTVAVLLENQIQAMKEEMRQGQFHTMLVEDHPLAANHSGIGTQVFGKEGTEGFDGNAHMAGYDPVLINLVRRAMPQLIAFDVCGVQPMTAPTGLIFAMKSKYTSQGQALPEGEALFNEANTAHSGKGTHSVSNWAETAEIGGEMKDFEVGTGMTTLEGERLGTDGASAWGEMAFSIERTSVVAHTRALKAEYTMELAQDLKAVHGLDAEAELSNILASEILAEINREIIRTIYITAEWGAQTGTMTKGVFDLNADSDGRWSAERFKGLMYRIEREANAIAQRTRRGRGNFIICSSDVASALQMAGMLDYSPALQNKLHVDEAANTFVGVLNGQYKVFVDPYQSNGSEDQFFVVGYKGASAYDAGMFYCPYVPLQLVRAQDPHTFQPKIGFKTRYGIAFNPQVQIDAKLGTGEVSARQLAGKNYYYRKVIVKNL